MSFSELLLATDQKLKSRPNAGNAIELGPAGLYGIREVATTRFEATAYQPVVCLILQGSKETVLGKRRVALSAGQSLIVSHDVHVSARITEASRDKPYLALVVAIDLGILRSLYDELSDLPVERSDTCSFLAHDAEPELIDALGRYMALEDRPQDVSVMAPLIRKEIHFRLLAAPHGAMLRDLLWRDSHASRIARAISTLQREFRNSISVTDLASVAGMSASSFHEHFKSITATTPLQYQKDLRLSEARRLLTGGARSVSATAFEVGYESPTQFSREYARKFGASPRADTARMASAV